MHDALTGLPNRACFYERTEQALRSARRDDASTAVLLFDLDRFKEINDTLGHRYGDLVLQDIGPRISAQLRPQDTLARLGGATGRAHVRTPATNANPLCGLRLENKNQ